MTGVAKKRAVDLHPLSAALSVAGAGERQQAQMSAYAKNGSDPEAVKNRLMGKGNCHCKRSAAGCHRSVPLGPLRHVCATFWNLTDQERAFAVRAMYLESATSDVRGPHDAQAGQDSDSPDTVPRNVQWALVGTPVCFHTWCHLLGTSSKAIQKYIQGMHDLRRHGRKIAPGTVLNPQGQHVDFFSKSCTAQLRNLSLKPLQLLTATRVTQTFHTSSGHGMCLLTLSCTMMIGTQTSLPLICSLA